MANEEGSNAVQAVLCHRQQGAAERYGLEAIKETYAAASIRQCQIFGQRSSRMK